MSDPTRDWKPYLWRVRLAEAGVLRPPWWQRAVRALKCRLDLCGGRVVTGIHGDWIWVGLRCWDCGRVKHYEPSRRLPG